ETQLLKLRAADGFTYERTGISVAVGSDGARAVVGTWDETWTRFACAFDGATGTQLLKLWAADGANGDGFGKSVAVGPDGALAVVGAWGDDGPGTWTGSAYVFDGTTGAQMLKLWAADGGPYDSFGSWVAVSSDGARVVVGAHYDDDAGRASSCAHVFDGAIGAQLLKLRAPDGAADDRLGFPAAVSSDGARAVAGASRNDDTGSACVFDGATGPHTGSACVFDGTTGAQLLKLWAADGASYHRFGWSVAMSSDGSLAVVGAHSGPLANDVAGPNFGSAYVFDGTTGAQLAKLLAADGAIGDEFGRSVAASSDGARAVVGAWSDDDAGLSSCSAHVLSLPRTTITSSTSTYTATMSTTRHMTSATPATTMPGTPAAATNAESIVSETM
ncbi:unnamed protein product, partial [Prorocentrum cordatum]